jgi:hypothetical protein
MRRSHPFFLAISLLSLAFSTPACRESNGVIDTTDPHGLEASCMAEGGFRSQFHYREGDFVRTCEESAEQFVEQSHALRAETFEQSEGARADALMWRLITARDEAREACADRPSRDQRPCLSGIRIGLSIACERFELNCRRIQLEEGCGRRIERDGRAELNRQTTDACVQGLNRYETQAQSVRGGGRGQIVRDLSELLERSFQLCEDQPDSSEARRVACQIGAEWGWNRVCHSRGLSSECNRLEL